jgi:hypothetical protein
VRDVILINPIMHAAFVNHVINVSERMRFAHNAIQINHIMHVVSVALVISVSIAKISAG